MTIRTPSQHPVRPFHDPSRPRSAGDKPQWDNEFQTIPGVHCIPSPDTTDGVAWVLLTVFVARAWNDHIPLRKEIPEEKLSDFMQSYRLDPEGTLWDFFDFVIPPKGPRLAPADAKAQAREATRTLTLDDLI